MKRNIWILNIFVILLAVGCLDDKTSLPSYSIPMPDSVVVTNNATGEKQVLTEEDAFHYIIEPGEQLSLSAQVFSKEFDNFRYEWQVAVIEGSDINMEIVSESETFERTIYEDSGGVLLVYCEGYEGAFTYPFGLTIAAPYSTGVMVLGNQGGKGVLDFIEVSATMEDVVFNGQTVADFTRVNHIPHEDIYPLCNNGEEFPCDNVLTVEQMDAISIATGTARMVNYYQILDADYTKAVTVNNTTIEKITMLSDEFTEIPDNLRPKNFIESNPLSLLLDESGKVYARINYDDGVPCTGRFTSEPLAYDDPSDFPDKGSEVIEATQIYPGGLVYEAAKKRFLIVSAIASSETISLASFSETSLPDNYLPLGNFDADRVLGVYQYANYYYYVIYQKDGDYYIQNFMYMDMMGLYTMYTPVNSLKVSDDVKQLWDAGVSQIDFQANTAIGNCFYFATGNALYRILISGVNLEKLFECDANIARFALTPYSTRALSTAAEKYFNGNVYTLAFDNGDVKVLKVYEDPQQPGAKLQESLWEKHYDGGVSYLKYCTPF